MKSIDIFPWNKHFNIGLKTVDEQHRKLVKILNRLATLTAYKSKKQNISIVLDELIDYTCYHFKEEEEIWSKYLSHNSLTHEHQKAHKNFLETVLRFKAEQHEKSVADLADEALSFLSKWLASHILDTDRHMAYIVIALQNGDTLEDAKVVAKDKMNGSSSILIDIILSTYNALSSNTLNLMRELKTHRVYENQMSYQEEYIKLLLNLSTSFVNLPLDQLDFAIQESLAKMSTFVDADRSYIFNYDMQAKTVSNTYEWCSEGITPQIDELKNIPIKKISGWFAAHSKGQNVLVQDVLELPKGALRNLLVSQSIQSLVTIPIMQDDICKGFVGFDSVKNKHYFSEDEIELLNLFSKLLSNIDDRKRTEAELSHEKSFLKTLIQTIPDLIWLKNPDGIYLACNTRFEDFFGAKEKEIVGKSDYDFVDKELADFFRFYDKKAIDSKKTSVNEKKVSFASDGHTEMLQTTKVPMYNAQNKLLGILGIARDITQQQELYKKLKFERDYFETYLDTVEAMIISLDTTGKILLVNRKTCELLGYTQDELIGENWFEKCLLQPEGINKVYPFFLKILKNNTEGTEYFENSVKTKSGEDKLIAWHNSYIRDDNGKIISTLSAGEDITERQKQQRHLEYIAHYDALTGLPNRVLLSDRIQQAMVQTNRHNLSIAVVYLDLDKFKFINDTYGHDYGDKFLASMAENMKATLRDGDTIARLGGDEFVAVLLDLKSHEDSLATIKRLLHECSREILINGTQMQVTASLGVTFFDKGDDLDADQLLRQSDQAMYQAKLLGKNRYYLFDAQKDKKTRTYHESLDEIKKALLNDEFTLYYQPKVNMKTTQVIGLEALIRWEHPKHGLLLPDSFLPVIEGHTLSVEFGSWVLKSALKQISQWKEKGLDIAVSINVDAMQLQDIHFVEKLKILLNKNPYVNPKNIMLEILETSALEDIVHVSKVMQECKDIGVSFSLDDFGTGYSSLTYLKRLPAKELKIDKSFVRGMLEDVDDLAILDGVLGLVKAFRREVIAEGVESVEHGKMLLKLGCENAQGYIIARPMPAENIINWVKQYKPNKEWTEVLSISIDEMPLLYALVEHKAWRNDIFSYLKDMRKIPPILSYKECRLGSLIYEEGKKEYGKHPAFEKFEKLHHTLHDVASVIIEKYENNTLEDVQTSIKEIDKLSKNMIKIFQQIEDKEA